jgi:hypothetical protein
MPQTYRDSHIYEVAVLVKDYVDDGEHERARAGDIIAVRREDTSHGGVGYAEMSGILWLRIDGGDTNVLGQMTGALTEADPQIRYNKRRFSIGPPSDPFRRLKQLRPSLDLNRVVDPNDMYQPFLSINEPDDVTETFVGLDTSTVRVTVPGTFRVPITEAYNTIDDLQVTNLPAGWTWTEPFQQWLADAKAWGGRKGEVVYGRENIKNARRNRLRQGPLLHMFNDVQQLADTTCDITITGDKVGVGEYTSKEPPFDYEGLVFDKKKMEYC